MELTLNGLTQPQEMVCLSDVPNILTLSDDSGGTRASVTLMFKGSLASVTDSDRQWSITMGSESVQNVLSEGDVQNSNFRAMTNATDTAASVARALRACQQVYAMWQVRHSGDTVTMVARNYGVVFTDGFAAYFATNITSAYLDVYYTEGSVNSSLSGKLIDVDIEDGDGNLITTLEKTYIDGSVSFNLSPTFQTMTDSGVTYPFVLRLSSYKGGDYEVLGEITDNWLSEGYKVSYSDRYLTRPEGRIMMAQCMTGLDGGTIPLYTYGAEIPIWFYNGSNNGGMTIRWECLDSAEELISSGMTTWRDTDSSKPLKHISMAIPPTDYSLTFHFDITLGNTKIRYNVIKPLNATGRYRRVFWLNEYGGQSFFDFTGEITESDTLTTETYKKNNYDYYVSDELGLTRTYSVNSERSVTMRTHLMGKDGTLVFDSLMRSPKVWYEREDGYSQILLVSTVSSEQTGQDGVYRCTVSFKESNELR